MLGAAPTTVTDSFARASTAIETTPPSSVLTSTGRATCPPGITTITWNGGEGGAFQVNSPLASVFAVPGIPGSVTTAPGIGLPEPDWTTRPDRTFDWAMTAPGTKWMRRTANTNAPHRRIMPDIVV